MIGFFGCALPSSALVERTYADLQGGVTSAWNRVGAAVWFGPRDAFGVSDQGDWVVVVGYARVGRRLLDGATLLDHLRRRGAPGVADLTGELALAACIDGRTFIARDRYGTRPLYYAAHGGGHVFATAIRPLLAAGVSAEVDRSAVVTSLVLGYVPAPRTALAHVRQVQPGQFVHLGRVARPSTYYAPVARVRHRNFALSASALDDALTEAVEQAPASGRVGAFLSGGLDSSIVLARLREVGHDIEAFTLHFGDTLPSEIRYAEEAARHVGVRHHVLTLRARAFCDALEPALRHLEDLLSEPIAVPNFLLAREAARTRDVVFTGEGGDPIFGGPKNVGMVLERMYGARRLGAAYLSAHHHLADDLDLALMPDWRRAFDDAALAREIEHRIEPRVHGETFVGQLMATNLAMKGGSNILVKVSKMVGAHGVALRSPLFDPRVIELGLAIPPWHKLQGTGEKMILKRAVARSLPASIIDRPKRGMSVPLRAWFDGPLGRLAGDVLAPRRIKERGIFRPDYVRKLLSFEKLPSDLARSRAAEKLWLVLVCELHQRSLEQMGVSA